MPIEEAQLKVTADIKEAEREIIRLRGQVESLQRALNGGATGQVDFAKKAKLTEEQAGKTATAMSGLAGAMGGVGSKSAAATGAIGNLLAAFTGGGGLLVGLSLAAIALEGLVTWLYDLERAANQVDFTRMKGLKESITLVDTLTEAIKEQRKAQKGLTEDKATLARRELEAEKAALEGTNNRIKRAEKAIAFEKEEQRLLRTARKEDDTRAKIEASQQRQQQQQDLLNNLKAQNAERSRQIKVSQELVGIYEKEQKRTKALEEAKEKESKARTSNSKAIDKEREALEKVRKADAEHARFLKRLEKGKAFARGLLEPEEQARAAAEAAAKAEAEAIAKRNAHIDGIRAHRDKENRKRAERLEKQKAADALKAHKEMLRKKEAAEKEAEAERMRNVEANVDLAMGFVSMGLSTTNQLMGAVITGQHEAIGQILAAQVAAVGTHVQGIGVQGIAQGLVQNAAVPGSGIPSMTIGAALIGVGTAMGGLGVAGQHLAAGGTIGQPLGGAGGGKGGVNHGSFGRGGGVGAVSRGSGAMPSTSEPSQTVTVMNFNGPTYNRNDTAQGIVAAARRAREDLLEPAR
jgi:hypothetical protein